MSAREQKHAAAVRIQNDIDNEVALLIEDMTRPFDQIRISQGIIKGLRLALVRNEEAFAHLGD